MGFVASDPPQLFDAVLSFLTLRGGGGMMAIPLYNVP
jgi:hypothetical protein